MINSKILEFNGFLSIQSNEYFPIENVYYTIDNLYRLTLLNNDFLIISTDILDPTRKVEKYTLAELLNHKTYSVYFRKSKINKFI